MKKDDLIKLAAARGITLSAAQAEKYTELSDEELENLSGGTKDCISGKEMATAYDCRACGERVVILDKDVPEGQPPTCPHCGNANLKYQFRLGIDPE
jgi:DNA-directed RNA polymerase subunit RPC12/RpoP